MGIHLIINLTSIQSSAYFITEPRNHRSRSLSNTLKVTQVQNDSELTKSLVSNALTSEFCSRYSTLLPICLGSASDLREIPMKNSLFFQFWLQLELEALLMVVLLIKSEQSWPEYFFKRQCFKANMYFAL